MFKKLNLVINTQLELPRGQIVEMLNSIFTAHFAAVDDDGKGVAATAHAWATVANAGVLHDLLSSLKNKSLQEAVNIMFPNPMPVSVFQELVHALSYDDMKQVVLTGRQHELLLQWAMLRMGDAVGHEYDVLVKNEELERKGKRMMLAKRAIDTLATIGFGIVSPEGWHGNRRKGDRTDRRKDQS